MASNIRMNRDQLYSLAAKASHGLKTELVVTDEKFSDGSIRIAIPVRDTAIESMQEAAHENGYAYFQMDRDGNTKTLQEEEL